MSTFDDNFPAKGNPKMSDRVFGFDSESLKNAGMTNQALYDLFKGELDPTLPKITDFLPAFDLSNARVMTSTAPDGKIVKSNILDPYGEYITIKEIDGSPIIDNIIYFSTGGKNYRRVFNGPVHVKWWGAKGDGVTDDTAAINAAIAHHTPTYMSSNYYPNLEPGVTISLEGGDYLVTDTILTHSNITLDGGSSIARIIFRPTSEKDFLNLDDSKYSWSNIQKIHFNVNLKNLVINGDYDPINLTGFSNIGLKMTNVSGSTLDNIFIGGFKNNILFDKIEGTVGMYHNNLVKVISRRSELHLDIVSNNGFVASDCSFSGGSGIKPNLRNLIRAEAAGITFLGCNFENITDPAQTNFAHINLVSGMLTVTGGYSEGGHFFAEINLGQYLSNAGRINLDFTNSSADRLYFYNTENLKENDILYVKRNFDTGNTWEITKNCTFQCGTNSISPFAALSASYEELPTFMGTHSLRVERVTTGSPTLSMTTFIDSYSVVNQVHFVIYNPDNHPITVNLFDQVYGTGSKGTTLVSEFDNGIQVYVRKYNESINRGSTCTINFGSSAPVGAVINILAVYVSDVPNFIPIAQRFLKCYVDSKPTQGKFKKGDKVYRSDFTNKGYAEFICTEDGDFSATPPKISGVGLLDQIIYPINVSTTSYTLIPSNVDSFITFIGTLTTGIVTVPVDQFESGAEVKGMVKGGQKTFVGGSGFTLRLQSGKTGIVPQYGCFTLKFLSPTEAVLTGDII